MTTGGSPDRIHKLSAVLLLNFFSQAELVEAIICNTKFGIQSEILF